MEKEIARLGFDSAGETSEREPVFISISEFRGNKYLNIRKFYQDGSDWKPTKKGVTVRKDQFEELLAVLQEQKDTILENL